LAVVSVDDAGDCAVVQVTRPTIPTTSAARVRESVLDTVKSFQKGTLPKNEWRKGLTKLIVDAGKKGVN
jgi:hypothetical protein